MVLLTRVTLSRPDRKWAIDPRRTTVALRSLVGRETSTAPKRKYSHARRCRCLMKSPLIIGCDVRSLPAESLDILKNKRLIEVNQDDLGIQGTLRATQDYNGAKYIDSSWETKKDISPSSPGVTTSTRGSPFVGPCTFGTAALNQQWQFLHDANGTRLSSADAKSCLSIGATVSVVLCDTNPRALQTQYLDIGRANVTVSQIRDPRNSSSCLAYDGSTLHMEDCRSETGDGTNAEDCWSSNCRFSSLSDQLFYLNGLGQLSLAFTNFQAPRTDPPRPNISVNVPMCLVTGGGSQPLPTPPPPPPSINTSLPLQVWAGPLSGGAVAVVLLNTGNNSAPISATWTDIGLPKGSRVTALNLWTGTSVTTGEDSVTLTVGSHDAAALRLTPTSRDS